MLRYKLLANQLESLKEELKLSNEIVVSAAKKVESLFSKSFNHPQDPPLPKIPENIDSENASQERPNNKPSKLTKHAFRKIALKIHPDKIIHLEGPVEYEEKIKLYQKAQAAHDDDEVIILVDIMNSLGIHPPEVSEIDLINTENKIRSIKKEIERIHSTLVWRWKMTYNKEEKDAILKELFRLLHERNKNKNPGP